VPAALVEGKRLWNFLPSPNDQNGDEHPIENHLGGISVKMWSDGKADAN
jgi:hypothetical protein